MRKPWGNRDAAHRQYLANLVEASGGDLPQALELALSGLEPDQRIEFVRSIIDGLPALMRAVVLGDAILGVGGWEATKATMLAEERRPRVVQALLEHGRRTRTLDFALIPADTDVTINCYRSRDIRTRGKSAQVRKEAYPLKTIELRAHGDGVFATVNQIDGIYQGRSVHRIIPPQQLITVGSMTAVNPHQSVVEYGSALSLHVRGEEEVMPVEYCSLLGSREGPIAVGSIGLDQQLVFDK